MRKIFLGPDGSHRTVEGNLHRRRRASTTVRKVHDKTVPLNRYASTDAAGPSQAHYTCEVNKGIMSAYVCYTRWPLVACEAGGVSSTRHFLTTSCIDLGVNSPQGFTIQRTDYIYVCVCNILPRGRSSSSSNAAVDKAQAFIIQKMRRGGQGVHDHSKALPRKRQSSN